MPQPTRARAPTAKSPSRPAGAGVALASDGTPKLPRPRLAVGKALPAALRARKTAREIGARRLPLQLLSNLLWAACGVNRAKGPFGTPGRTAASASNSQEIDVYVALAEGVFRFDAPAHLLELVTPVDLRALSISRGQRALAQTPPVQLIYVVDLHRLTHTTGFEEPGLHDPEVQKSYYFVDTGLIAGNVYLFAASQGLACWFHNCDRAGLAAGLSLREEQRVLFAQTVGYAQRA